MEIRLIDNSKPLINVYLFKQIDISLCNAIRRTIIRSIPVLAVEDVEIYTNESAHYDETVAHRLGLIPLVTDVDVYDEIRVSEELGSAKNEVEFSLEVSGPCIVTSEDLKFKDPSIKPVSGKDPITLLKENQTLKATGKACVNNGNEHAKWAPAHVFYSYKPQWVDSTKQDGDCPIFGKNIDTQDTVIKENDDIVFTVESWGQIEPNVLLDKALDHINSQCNELLKEIKN
ncbi:DNA-directed RNA polymerase subunit D [Candidatus Woesearchaeota archaeon]|nr:DNA-directed RNA polymerase subunit D [Candidatus Woesearchaeota archaeon]MBT4595742.1 DNA-directed RNA polymerase subunit D [Candidatus Woesearchaeota archaeon]MBT5741409.1 DNA-directed RNA polymerase subunit D [Candidatus Woesearchaeota archaeon]MBT6505231.1 DNA-directed RNA polymerase subunit D [Candidatus Woesearchaeota archaeon]MBT7296220.1 DNA-directed RNA polymerase subunit D [Candidatus Woesearchaeota archaeon]